MHRSLHVQFFDKYLYSHNLQLDITHFCHLRKFPHVLPGSSLQEVIINLVYLTINEFCLFWNSVNGIVCSRSCEAYFAPHNAGWISSLFLCVA